MRFELINDYKNVNPIVQKWNVIHSFILVWELKIEMNSLHLNDFTLIKVISS
jgi:hypothetical protein